METEPYVDPQLKEDMLPLSLKMASTVLPQTVNSNKQVRPTAVQLGLANPLSYKDGVLLCREGHREKALDLLQESGLGAVFEVLELTKQLKSS